MPGVAAVAIYTRISRDAEGRSEGVTAQEKACRRYARQAWPERPVSVFTDNDLSAADPDTRRPGYEQLLTAIRRGQVSALVAVEQSRLTRQPAEWEALTLALSKAGIDEVHTTRKGIVSTRTRLVGRILAAVDAEEVERLRARVNDSLDALAARGRPSGGRSYGYEHAGERHARQLVVIPEEADVARWAAERVLAGWSLTSIAGDLDARQAPTARGGRWTSQTVRSILRSPTIAGLRVHRGEVVGEGDWEAILDRDTWEAVRAKLTGPTVVRSSDGQLRRVSRRRCTPRRYLLTGGIAVCGRCGTPLVAQQRRGRTPGSQPAYLCHPSNGGCSGIGILAEPLEAHVTKLVLEALASPNLRAALADDTRRAERDRLAGELAAVEARRAELARRWARGELQLAEWEAAREVLEVDGVRAADALAGLPTAAVLADPLAVLHGWGAMTLGERRQVIASLVTSVAVGPARPGSRRFDSGRVTPAWAH